MIWVRLPWLIAGLLAICHHAWLVESLCNASYAEDGEVDFTATLYKCSEQMTDPEIIYSYKASVKEPITIYAQLALNNMIDVDELESTINIDFYFRLSWIDPRWDIPEMWAGQKADLAYQGFAIDQLVFDTSESKLRLWFPDISFPDQVDSYVVSQTFKIRPYGLLYWNRHLRMKIVQPQFSYEDYPLDTQIFNIRMVSYAYATSFLQLRFTPSPVKFVNAVYPDQDEKNWEFNSQWYLSQDGYSAVIWQDTSNLTAGTEVVTRTYDHAILILEGTRIADGILIRLGFPVVILMVLSGLVFWAAVENRIDATMTILLAISALYIVVFGNIPMIGYLTAFDKYVISMFFVLTLAVAIHQFVYRVSEKAERRPLRLVVVRFVEFFGRVFLFPVAIILFVEMFPDDFISDARIPVLVSISCVMIIIAWRDWGGVSKVFLNTMAYYDDVLVKDELTSMNVVELRVYYFYCKYMKTWCYDKKKKKAAEQLLEEEDDDHTYDIGSRVERARRRESALYGTVPPVDSLPTPARRVSAISGVSGSHNHPLKHDTLFYEEEKGTELSSFSPSIVTEHIADRSPPDERHVTDADAVGSGKPTKKISAEKQSLIDLIKTSATNPEKLRASRRSNY